MGMQPLPEGVRAGKKYPLGLLKCLNCSLVQLSYVVDPDELFAADHPYSTGNSAALRKHYDALAREVQSPLRKDDLVVDIGANDCTFLSSFSYPDRVRLLAVEPTDQISKGIPGITRCQEPWSRELARKLHAQLGYARVITACNVLAHVPDVHDFLDGVTELLGADGCFITENHDLHSITDGLQIDTIYHEHLRYYTAGTLARLLEDHGMRVEAVKPVPTHGGSFRTYAYPVRDNFPARAMAVATALRGTLHNLTREGRDPVYGIGAATRATPLIHYAGIAPYISAVCEVAGSDKIGQCMPGTSIPVIDEARLITDQPPCALVFSWHMAGYVLPKLRERGYKGQFIVPLPEPKVVSAADAYKEKPYA